jgi:RNA-binding protein YlmH
LCSGLFSPPFIVLTSIIIVYVQVTSANSQLKEGDIVTVRGKGRLEIQAVEKTSKDKFRVKMTKFA